MSRMASSVWCQSHSNHDSKQHVSGGKVKKSTNSSSVIPKKFCDFVFRRNVDNRVYRSESFRFIQKTDSFIAAGAARRSLKVPVIENYIDPVDYQEGGREEPSYHEIQERYNAPYYYSDTIKEAPEPPYCSPCPNPKSSYNFSRRGNSRGQIVRKCNNANNSSAESSNRNRDSTRSYIKNDNKDQKDSSLKGLSSSQVFCRQLLPRSTSPDLGRSESPGFPSRSTSPGLVLARSATPVLYSNSSPVLYRSSSPALYRSPSPVLYRSPSPVLYRSASPVPYRSVTPILYGSASPEVLPRSNSTPLDPSFSEEVTQLLEPLKSTRLEERKRSSSTPPPQQRNQFISVCQILNSPSGTITNPRPTPPLTLSQESPRETVVKTPSTPQSNEEGKVMKAHAVPFTHKYLKASVARDKRLQMLKNSRSISSLDSADSLRSNEEMRSICGYEPRASHSGSSSAGSNSGTTDSNNSSYSNNNNTVAIAVLDPSNAYYHPHCESPEYLRGLSHSIEHESPAFLPKLQPPSEPEEFYRQRPDPGLSVCNAPHLSQFQERPRGKERFKSRKAMSVHSCDNSSTCSSNVSLPPTSDHHYYTRLLGRNSGLGRLDEICYNHHPHSVKVDVVHGSKGNLREYENEGRYCPREESLCSMHSFMPHLSSDGKSHSSSALSDVNYVRPHRCWGNHNINNHHPVCKGVSHPYQFKVDLPLESQEWFHGAITRLESEKILEATKVGSFLVRNCENSTLNHFSLSIKCKRGFIHIRIEPNPNSGGTFTLAEQEFSSVPYLINHFMLNRLPIKGAEHVKLMYPVITQFL